MMRFGDGRERQSQRRRAEAKEGDPLLRHGHKKAHYAWSHGSPFLSAKTDPLLMNPLLDLSELLHGREVEGMSH